MLYAGQLARRGDVPLLGINRGRLGFLADVTPEEMLDSVGHVLAGEFTTDKRLVLEARLERLELRIGAAHGRLGTCGSGALEASPNPIRPRLDRSSGPRRTHVPLAHVFLWGCRSLCWCCSLVVLLFEWRCSLSGAADSNVGN